MKARIKSPLPAPGIEDRLFVSMLRATDCLSQPAEQLLKSAGLTPAQYNVLRILRGAMPEGLACSAISERMISRDPDMTRLLDRMEKRGWITRERQTDDRRVVKTCITEEGLKELRVLDRPIRELHKQQFSHLSQAKIKNLLDLLEEVARHEPTQPLPASNNEFRK